MRTHVKKGERTELTSTDHMPGNNFFVAIGLPIGESDLCQTDTLTLRALTLGIVPNDLPEDNQRKINRAIISKFIELGLEPIHFEKIGVVWYRAVKHFDRNRGGFITNYFTVFNRLTTYEPGNTDLSGADHARPGITVNSGHTEDAWERHTLARYVADGNGFPRKAVEVLEKLTTARLPIGASVMIWTPDRLTRAPSAGPAPDPLLVVEFSNGLCVPLCRWND